MKRNFLFIDPSTKRLGWAVFSVGNHTASLVKSGVEKLKSRKHVKFDWVFRCDRMMWRVTELCFKYKTKRIYVEMPRVYNAGRGAAASNSGAIMKLAFCVATIRARMWNPVWLLPVQIWKGTLPKAITRKRVIKHWQVNPRDHNEVDAIGMGDFVIRKKLNLRPLLHR